ncbi:solute carrier family 2, facilitated glucose transporter member 11 isoform X1 [Amia ocellicauda]|uniref:solute carrier family 2, facilitated glucose transporter member 11 isoform X1 n=2 Tax=Amia ocellicauda TaxID=2972642 RepID=UPI003464A4AA
METALTELMNYWRLMLLTVVLGIGGSFQYGIQVSIMASPSEHIQNFVNQTWMARYGEPVSESTQKLIWSFIVSIFSLGGWLGAINSGTIPVIYGRKKCLLFNNVVAIVAAVLMGFSRMAGSFEMILLGRILYGYNVGLGLSVHLMYLGECSPKKLRGFLTLSSAIFIGLGKVMGQICGLRELMGTEPMWPYLLALSGLPAVVQFLSLLCFPETPRYLYIDKGDEEGCKKALKVLWGNVETKLELEDMTKEREMMKAEKAKSVWDVLTSRSVRWQLLTLVIPCGLSQLCGFNAIYFYAFDIFREAGVPKDQMHYLSIGIGITELVTLTVCLFLIDRTGRKLLMGLGYLAMAVLLGILVVMLSLQDNYTWIPYFNIALIFSAICVFGLGPSGITLTLPAELFLQAWRPSAYVISGTCNWVSLFLIGMFFPYVADAMGQFCFLIFVAYCVLSAVFMLVFIPETKGKTMVEIMEDFNKLNFKGRGVDTEIADLALATKL